MQASPTPGVDPGSLRDIHPWAPAQLPLQKVPRRHAEGVTPQRQAQARAVQQRVWAQAQVKNLRFVQGSDTGLKGHGQAMSPPCIYRARADEFAAERALALAFRITPITCRLANNEQVQG